jgi:Mg2+ and Co2+ transporter CorA
VALLWQSRTGSQQLCAGGKKTFCFAEKRFIAPPAPGPFGPDRNRQPIRPSRSVRGMLKTYQLQNGGLKGTVVSDGGSIATESLWIDLFNPTVEERGVVNAALGMEMPTRADMEEIEVSSRLYHEDGGYFMYWRATG